MIAATASVDVGNIALPVSVQLADDHLREAESWSSEILTGLANRTNYTGVSSVDSFVIGYMGEWAVREWLELIEADYRWTVNLRGAAAEPEFVVHRNHQRRFLEVKTSSHPRARGMMFPASQKLDGDVYVAVRLATDDFTQAALGGWLTRAEVAALPVVTYRVPSRAVLFTNMRPMHQLARLLDRRCEVMRNPKVTP